MPQQTNYGLIAYSVALAPNNKIMVAGYNSSQHFSVARLNSDGTLDKSFGGTGRVDTNLGSGQDIGRSVIVQADGKILVAGYSDLGRNNGDADFAVVRYNIDGTLDATFGSNGKVTTAVGNPAWGGDYAYRVGLAADGSIIVSGSCSTLTGSNTKSRDFAIVKYKANGTIDTSFSSDGIATATIGTADDQGTCQYVQLDGKILIGGWSIGNSNNPDQYYFSIVRYNPDGSLDQTFGSGGKVASAINVNWQWPTNSQWNIGDVRDMIEQSDGKIIMAGSIANQPWVTYDKNGKPEATGGTFSFIARRFNIDGTIDDSFGVNGSTIINSTVGICQAVVIQGDGKILLGGWGANGSNPSDFNFQITRLNTDGSIDQTFNNNGILTVDFNNGRDYLFDMKIRNDGVLVVSGFTEQNASDDLALALIGTNNNDILTGTLNVDVFYGNAGNDTIIGGAGNDYINGGDGLDTANYSNSTADIIVDLSLGTATGVGTIGLAQVGVDTLVSVENIIGSSGNDTIILNSTSGTFDGGTGTNTLSLSNVNTAVSIDLNAGIVATAPALQVTSSAIMSAFPIMNAAIATDFTDVVKNFSVFIGTNQADTFKGGAGTYSFKAGAGNDTIDGGQSNLTVIYSGNYADYKITKNANGTYTIADQRISASDGTDTVKNAKSIYFLDKTISVASITGPPAPIITLASTLKNNPKPLISGTATAGFTVTVYDGSTSLGTAVADAKTGIWSFTPASALSDAAHTITAKATDTAGNVSAASAAVTLTIDTAPPTAPAITTTSAITNKTKPAIAGTAEKGSTVTVYDGGTSIGTAVADAKTGAWSFTPTKDLLQAVHTITAKAADAVGNVSDASTAITLTVDTTAPDAPVMTSKTASINNAKPSIAGTAEIGSTISIYDGTSLLGTTTVSAGNNLIGVVSTTGAWTFTPTKDLGQSAHTITATSTDAAGNVSKASTPIILTVDTVAPAKATLSQGAGVNSKVLTLTGVETGGVVKILNDGSDVTSSFTKGGSGATLTYTANTSAFTGSETIKLTAVITDAAGNASEASNAVTSKIDTTAPIAPTLAQGSGVNAKVLTLTGLEANGTVKILDGTTDVTSKFTAGDNATFTAKAGAFAGSETLSLKVAVTDAAGNTSASSNAVTGKIDSTASDAPLISTKTASINNAKPAIAGTAEKGSTVTVYDGSTSLGTAVADAKTGIWSFTPASALSDAAHTITAKATDTAGNVSAASAAVTLTIDTAPPTAPAITTTSAITNKTKPAIAGTAEKGSTVTVYDGGTSIGTAVADAKTGAWSFTPTKDLLQAVHTITAKAADAVGNVSDASTAITLTVDTTAPSAPTLATATTTTNLNKPVITGTAEVDSTVSVYEGTKLLGTATATAINNSNSVISTSGVWTFTPTTALIDGSHTLTAKAIDAAGNISSASTPLAITVAPEKASWVGVTGNTYLFYATPKSWVDANTFAKQIGGHLVKVDTPEENSDVYSHVLSYLKSPHDPLSVANDGGGSTYVWLGGTADLTKKTWSWSYDKTPIDTTSTLWGSGASHLNGKAEPDYSTSGGQTQNSLALGMENWPTGSDTGKGYGDAGHWNDVFGTDKLYFVVEVESVNNQAPKSSIHQQASLFVQSTASLIPATSSGLNSAVSSTTTTLQNPLATNSLG